MKIEIAIYAGLTIATDLLWETIKKLPEILEARSFKNDIESELEIIKTDLDQFETKVDTKKIEIDEFIQKCTEIFEKLIPVKIKIKKYSATYATSKDQANIDIAFNLLTDLDSKLQAAKTDVKKITIVRSRTVREIARRIDPKITKLTLRTARKLLTKTKLKKKPSPEVLDEFKKASHRFAIT
jgi:predicted  nucleic acid-binding Zn-ribbon protein